MSILEGRFVNAVVAVGLIIGLAACGGGGDNSDDDNPTATATTRSNTSTPTTQPTATRTPIVGVSVNGLVVVNQSVSGRSDDRLGLPPAAWTDDASNVAFDKALGLADWTVAENPDVTGATEAD